MAIKQNRNGHTDIIPYMGYEIQIRKAVRNDSDISYSVIVTEPIHGEGYLIKKRFSNIKTREKEKESIEKAKKFIEQATNSTH